jgi:hypothetical protein
VLDSGETLLEWRVACGVGMGLGWGLERTTRFLPLMQRARSHQRPNSQNGLQERLLGFGQLLAQPISDRKRVVDTNVQST